MRRAGPLLTFGTLVLAACAPAAEPAPAEPVKVDCATTDTSDLSPFVIEPFQRDLAIDTVNRVREHLDRHPPLICLELRSRRYGELPVIGYAMAHTPDAYTLFPLLVERGANPADALPIGVQLGKSRSVPWLLDHGVDPDSGDALVVAAAADRTRLVELLLEAGAEPDRIASPGPRGSEGKTALHLAARHGRAEMIEVLLRAGADVNAPDALGRPPLIEAVRGRDVPTIRLLFEHGANPWLLPEKERDRLRRLATRWRLQGILDEIG